MANTAEVNRHLKAMSEYAATHDELGCYQCKFADKKSLGKKACCTHMHGPYPNDDGKCERGRQ
jgi:hypothetical protein